MYQGGFSRFFLRVTACPHGHVLRRRHPGVHALSEVVGQSLAFSILLVAWYRRPHRAWGIVLYTLIGLVVLMSVAGALVPR